MFDVALEDASKPDARNKNRRGSTQESRNSKRQKKDSKFGFGGKKRHAKSNDAASAGDLSGFSNKANKARFGNRNSVGKSGAKGGKKRPGKSVRAARR